MTKQNLDTRQLTETGPIGVWLTQPDGRIVFISRSMWEWLEKLMCLEQTDRTPEDNI